GGGSGGGGGGSSGGSGIITNGSGHIELAHQFEVMACRNMADQLLYLNAELSSPRNAAVHVHISCDFWVQNLSGLPLTLGEPVLRVDRGVGSGSAVTAGAAGAAGSPRHHGGSGALDGPLAPGSPSSDRGGGKKHGSKPTEVLVAAAQGAQVVEEVFELRVRHQYGEEEILWVTDYGNPRPPPNHIRLPSPRWHWADDWAIDYSGAVARDLPGLDGGGWESCGRQNKGIYSGRNFGADRSFRQTDRVWRRRWMRTRVPDAAEWGVSQGKTSPVLSRGGGAGGSFRSGSVGGGGGGGSGGGGLNRD
ncbi:unnamed protein product, partial [Phaeothamnion confervicola]